MNLRGPEVTFRKYISTIFLEYAFWNPCFIYLWAAEAPFTGIYVVVVSHVYTWPQLSSSQLLYNILLERFFAEVGTVRDDAK